MQRQVQRWGRLNMELIEIQFIEMAWQEGSSSAYESRYKSIESEEDTRNPTTNKKVHGTPLQFRRSNPYLSAHHPPTPAAHSPPRSFSEQLNLLEAQKQQCMRVGRLRQAEALHNRIARTRSASQAVRVRVLQGEQKAEKRAVSAAHRSEMHHLHRVWQDYFRQLRQREIDILESFKNYQRTQIRTAREQLQRSRERQELHRREAQCIAESRFKELRAVRRQLAEAEKRQEEAKRKTVGRWAELQEERLSASQARKYSALMSRLEEYRQDKEKVYLREQKRLKQKYKNVLAQLQHEQTMELSSLARLLALDH